MSYKTILVHLSDENEATRLIPIAKLLARQFEAHLIGVYAIHTMEIYSTVSVQISGSALSEIDRAQQEQALRVKKIFESETHAEDFVTEWRLIESSHAASGELVAQQAHCADLVIMGQIDTDSAHATRHAAMRHVIEHSGCPVLVIPRYGEFKTIGQRVLIGWSDTGESARAAHDAIPFFQGGTSARVFWVTGTDQSRNSQLENSGHELAQCLDRHGAKATVSHRLKIDIPIGDELLNEASDTDADLIVTGAFGHSRLFDFVIGATTSHLLQHMTVPVLFSR